MTVSRDTASGWYLPANASEWTELLAGTGLSNPFVAWGLQEASGNFSPIVGSATLGASLIAGYQQSETGWTRKFITMTPQGGGRSATSTNTTGFAALSTTSQLNLVFFGRTATVTAERDIMRAGFSGTQGCWATITASHTLKCKGPTGNVATGSVALAQNTVIPIVLQHDRTNSVTRVVTESESIAPTFAAAVGTDRGVALGSTSGSGGMCAPAEYCYLAVWNGTAAEMSSAQLATLFSRLRNGAGGTVLSRNRLVNDGRVGPLTKGSSVN